MNELGLRANARVNTQMFIKYWESVDMRPLFFCASRSLVIRDKSYKSDSLNMGPN